MSRIDGSFRTSSANDTRTQEVRGAQSLKTLKGTPSMGADFMRKIEGDANAYVAGFVHKQGTASLQELLSPLPLR